MLVTSRQHAESIGALLVTRAHGIGDTSTDPEACESE
jgi:hypothetical protein